LGGVPLEVLNGGAEGGLTAQAEGLKKSEIPVLGELFRQEEFHRPARLVRQVRSPALDQEKQGCRALGG
jgi:hypothetical protein